MLLRGGHVVRLTPPGFEKADLRIEAGQIVGRAPRLTPRRDERVEDCAGKVILPGLVCAHTHMYSALARAMPAPRTATRTFPEILDKVWWKLDEALDDESIYASAIVGAIEAVRCGTTTIIDHHASPNAIVGSLDIIREAFRAVGVRGVLCYEVTDRGGTRRRNKGLVENDRFLSETRDDEQFRGLVGAHASFTLGDRTLAGLSELVHQHHSGIHVHVAEAPDDVELTAREHGCGIVDRLMRFGLLNERAVLVHGVHLTEKDLHRTRAVRAWHVHNPRSNMNNGVGHAAVQDFGARAALGTDGWPADMLAEAQFAYFRQREDLGPASASSVFTLLEGGQQLASALFSRPFGSLEAGSVADLVIVDYESPTPIDAGNGPWHVLFGVRTSMIERVMVGGRWVLRNGRIVGLDLGYVMEQARREAQRLWTRMRGRSKAV
jgi:putative selenium metabolism protein SsnA